jgi:hypothetical protein
MFIMIWIIGAKLDLTDMLYAPSSGYKDETGCLEGTRMSIIEEIHDWIHDLQSDTCQVLWLSGLAGTGKSSIAHTVGKQLDKDHLLGSFFCFDASRGAECGPQHLFSTTSHNLASFDKHWHNALGNIINGNKSLSTTGSVQRQFDELLLKPAQSLQVFGPIVIIIDALDECGDASSRETLLSLLAINTSALPGNFRIIVTSRPDKDIVDAFQKRPHFYYKDMDGIDKEATNHDIYKFVRAQLSTITLLDQQWPEQAWCQLLANKAEGLFQWASTACLFVKKPMGNPIKQLQFLLDSTRIEKLDHLYHQILNKIVPDDSTRNQLKSILGTLLVAKESLTVSMVSKLSWGIDPIIVKGILQHMGSLFRGVSQDYIMIQPLHTSVRDFFLSKSQSHEFWVDTMAAHESLIFQLLNIMKTLHFNICHFPTSYLMNKEINDLDKRVEKYISAELSYACQFWTSHLEHITFKEDIYLEVKIFMTSKLFYWLEVLSVSNAMRVAIGSLGRVATWVKVRKVILENKGLCTTSCRIMMLRLQHLLEMVKDLCQHSGR